VPDSTEAATGTAAATACSGPHCEQQGAGDQETMDTGFNKESFIIPSLCIRTDRKFALDIGGSLAKVVYVSKPRENSAENETEVHLVTFDTGCLDECLNFIKKQLLGGANSRRRNNLSVMATGVGCLKFQEKIKDALHANLQTNSDEILYARHGLNFMWQHLPESELLQHGSNTDGLKFRTTLVNSGLTPCLLVNLGSAMTIGLIDTDGTMKGIVGGSSLGGLSFLGLGALLTKAKNFSELVSMAEKGDRKNVDLLVKDTAGADYHLAPSDSMVSSFGKAARLRTEGREVSFAEEDIASSLLYSITDNLAQTSYLVAKGHDVHRAVFCGSYLASNRIIIDQINTKLHFASLFMKYEVKPVFMQHEGYLGAIGALVSQDMESRS